MAYKPTSDKILFIIASLLATFGLVMVYSASAALASDKHAGDSAYFLLRQLLFAGLGYGLMVGLMYVDYHILQNKKLRNVLLAVIAASLVLVFLCPPINNSHRWLRVGSISLQPSEFAKLALLIFVAGFLHKHEQEINNFRERLLPCLAVVLSFAALIVVEPDLGQALCLLFVVFILLFAAGLNWKLIGTGFLFAIAAAVLAVVLLPDRFDRLLTYLDRTQDPLGSAWQITQALTAIGSGGLLGVGLGGSTQKLFFLPEAHSDFIFAIIGEELGLCGAGLLCLAFVLYFYRGIKTALKAPDLFGYYLGMGITLMVVMQAFINISMVLALLPTKGIALPFISQGGSSLLMNLMATGILLNISNFAEKT
jgi:cell division protein FtsW